MNPQALDLDLSRKKCCFRSLLAVMKKKDFCPAADTSRYDSMLLLGRAAGRCGLLCEVRGTSKKNVARQYNAGLK